VFGAGPDSFQKFTEIIAPYRLDDIENGVVCATALGEKKIFLCRLFSSQIFLCNEDKRHKKALLSRL
jgi:hypothetical protein